MTTLRDEFEAWASDGGEYPKAVQRAGNGYLLAITQTYWIAWQAATERAAKKEREECAKLCDAMSTSDYLPFQCATAIRNRAPCTCKPGLESEQTCEKHAAQSRAAAIRAREGKGATDV